MPNLIGFFTVVPSPLRECDRWRCARPAPLPRRRAKSVAKQAWAAQHTTPCSSAGNPTREIRSERTNSTKTPNWTTQVHPTDHSKLTDPIIPIQCTTLHYHSPLPRPTSTNTLKDTYTTTPLSTYTPTPTLPHRCGRQALSCLLDPMTSADQSPRLRTLMITARRSRPSGTP